MFPTFSDDGTQLYNFNFYSSKTISFRITDYFSHYFNIVTYQRRVSDSINIVIVVVLLCRGKMPLARGMAA